MNRSKSWLACWCKLIHKDDMDGALAWVLGLGGSLIGGLSLSGLLISLLTARKIRRLEERLDRLSNPQPEPNQPTKTDQQ